MGEKKFFWIKLKTDFFNQDEIDYLMSQKNGCEYIVLYQMLCLQTANNGGMLSRQVGEMLVPYDVNKIVRDTKYFDFDTVAVALELFKKLGLIYEMDDSILKIARIEEMVGSESANANAIRQKRFREKQKLQSVTNSNANSNGLSVTNSNIEIEKEIEIRDRDRDRDRNRNRVDYQQIADIYNDTCVSFPRLVSLSDARKKAIKARLNKYTLDDFKKVFEKAEASDFLKGANDRNWAASFDWMLKDANFAKIIEGNYDNRKPKAPKNAGNRNPAAELEEFYKMAEEWADKE